MKKLLLLFSLCPVFLLGQVKIDFEKALTEGWEQNPAERWGISSENPLSGFYSLSHVFDNSESGSDAISYHLGELYSDSAISWSFLLNYDYKPSGSNNWAVYLLSEGSSFFFNGENNAVLLGVNQSSTDDSLCIYLQEKGKLSVLEKFPLNWEIDIGTELVNFMIIKDDQQVFRISLKFAEEDQVFEFTSKSVTELSGYYEYFGIVYNYTSSKDRLLHFDDLEIEASFYSDTFPPVLENTQFLSKRVIQWDFDENIFLEESFKLLLDSTQSPDSVYISGNSLFAVFPFELENEREYTFEIEGVGDKKGNSRVFTGEFLFYYPVYKDILFTEIMADPAPAVYLPEEEYLEIHNRGSHTIDMENFILDCGSRSHLLPSCVIGPGEYRLIVFSEESAYKDYPDCIVVSGSATELTNSGLLLSLSTPGAVLIDALQYSKDWYDDELKQDGGWSIERIDIENLCGEDDNWSSSINPDGGSPGMENSIKGIIIDQISPYPMHTLYSGDYNWIMNFNESIDFISEPGNLFPDVLSLERIFPLYKEVLFNIDSTRIPLKTELPVFISDCSGNTNKPEESLVFGIPEKAAFLDILITEIMFSPVEGAPEYIELYNFSDKILSLADLVLEVKGDEGEVGNLNYFTDRDILFFPGTYLVLNPDNEGMKTSYYLPERFCLFQMDSWSNLPQAEGMIILKDRSGNTIDEMLYSEDLHFPLLYSLSGISLERIFLDANPGSSSEWHSASSLADYATPGFPNSQARDEEDENKSFYCETEKFSPDNDGMDDFAVFICKLEIEGYVGDLKIFDPVGRIVRHLGANLLMGIENQIVWDGLDNNGNICASGIYLAYLEVFHLSGRKKSFKETVVLLRTGW